MLRRRDFRSLPNVVEVQNLDDVKRSDDYVKLYHKMKKIYLFLLVFLQINLSFAQQDTTDLLALLGADEPTTEYAKAAFKTNRVINGHSLESTARGVLDFKINHRFGFLNGGAYELFGLDQAYIRIGFDYGISDRLSVGIGRNSYEKVYDGFVKYKILRQSSGKKTMPITLAYIATIDHKTAKWSNAELANRYWLRAYYTHQLLIGRKFSEGTSLQLMPTFVHRNFVKTKSEKNDVLLLGVAARQKLTKRTAINVEYYYALPNQLAAAYRNTLSVGFDIETGGHVFQLFFTNSNGTDHRSFLTETTGKWSNGDVRFGFNVSRVFTVKK
jgi:hypothetical protein